MSSIDRKRIVGKSDEELDELICGICHDVYEEPVVTICCQQTYCCVCIKQWLIDNNNCPNDRTNLTNEDLMKAPRLIINLINKMSIKCEYYLNGCEVISTVGEIKNHIKTCNKRSVLKCNSCEESKKVITNYEKEIKELKRMLISMDDQAQGFCNELRKFEKLKIEKTVSEKNEEEMINEARSYRPIITDVKIFGDMSNTMASSFMNISINAVNNLSNKSLHSIAFEIRNTMNETSNDFQFIVYIFNGSYWGMSTVFVYSCAVRVKYGSLTIYAFKIDK